MNLATRDFTLHLHNRPFLVARLVWRPRKKEMLRALAWYRRRTGRKRTPDCLGMFIMDKDRPDTCAVFASGTGRQLIRVILHELQHLVDIMLPGKGQRVEDRAIVLGLLAEDMLHYLSTQKTSRLTDVWRRTTLPDDVRKPRRK